MVDYKTIGNADPIGTIQKWQDNESVLATRATNRAVSDLNMQKTKQDIDIKQRAVNKKIEAEKQLDLPKSIEGIKMRMEGGGEKGTAGGWLLDLGRENGFIDMSQGGDGTITERNFKKLGQMVKDNPAIGFKVSRMRVDTSRQKLLQLQQMAAKKPDDPKIQAEIQKTNDALNQALFADKAFADAQKEHNDLLGKQKEKQDFTLGQGQQRFDADGNKIASVAPKADNGGGTDKIQKYKKEMVAIKAAQNRVASKEGYMDLLTRNPEFAQYIGDNFGDPQSESAKESYLKVLDARYKELSGLTGTDYGAGSEDKNKPTHTFIPGKGIVEK